MFSVANTFKSLLGTSTSRKLALAAAGAMALAAPAAVNAVPGRNERPAEHREPVRREEPRREESRPVERHNDRDHRDGRVDVDIHLGKRGDEYEDREVQVWVPAVYRTVLDHQWVEPVYRTETERVRVGNHYELRERQVCVTEGHWEDVQRQECVSEGHYETHIEHVKVERRLDPLAVVNPMLGLAIRH